MQACHAVNIKRYSHMNKNDSRGLSISQQALLLLELLEQLVVSSLLDEIVNGLNIPLLRDINAAVLLANAFSPLQVNHAP